MPARHPYLDHDGPIAFAHRGGTSAAPENTMAAFQDAVDLGYTHVETDVHVTSDGVLVAFHDNDLERTCGIKGRIEETPWSALSEARVDGSEPIPRLEEVFAAWPDLRINLDCKTPEAEEPLARFLGSLGNLDRVCFGSFSDARLARFRARFGDRLCTSTGPREVARLLLHSRARVVPGRTPALAAQVPERQGPVRIVTRRFVEACHAAGMQVHVWTVNEEEDMHRLLDLGVDGIMSDETRVLRQVMSSRGGIR